MQADIEDELVPVMVPRRLLTKTYAFIASMGEHPVTPSDDPVLHRGWRKSLILEVYEACSERMRVLLDLLASRPNEKLYLADFRQALTTDDDNFVNGVLGGFGRLTSERFAPRLPNGEHTWPFSAVRDIRKDGYYYLMPKDVADVIKDARAGRE